jgi:hypothetical protein
MQHTGLETEAQERLDTYDYYCYNLGGEKVSTIPEGMDTQGRGTGWWISIWVGVINFYLKEVLCSFLQYVWPRATHFLALYLGPEIIKSYLLLPCSQ